MISNSFGTQESGFSQAYSADYDHPGHVIVVANGDLGFTAANFPANLASARRTKCSIHRRACSC